MTTVTIGIPFYNAESTLADAIRSVFAQTFQDWQLILADDGSTDGSLGIARAVRDERVRILAGAQNRGVACVMNEIVRMARAEYVARLDADDLMHPERLERQLELLRSKPNLNVVGASIYTMDSANNPVGKRASTPITARRLLQRNCVGQTSVTARSSFLRENPYDTEFRRAQDYELWCRTWVKGVLRAERLPAALSFHREAESVSLSKILASYRWHRKVLRRFGPRLCNTPLTCMEIAKTHGKELAHCLFAAAGRQMILVSRRSQSISEDEAALARSVLRSVLRTRVPGLPDPESFPNQHASVGSGTGQGV